MSCTATLLLSMVMTINLCYEESEEGGYSLEERDKVYSLEFGGGGIKSLSRSAFCRRRYEQESVGQGCKHPS